MFADGSWAIDHFLELDRLPEAGVGVDGCFCHFGSTANEWNSLRGDLG